MKAQEIAELVEGQLVGDGGVEIRAVAPIDRAQEGDISFIAGPSYAKHLATTGASVLLVPKGDWQTSKTLIVVDNPYFAFRQVLEAFYPPHSPLEEGIHPTAIVGPNTQLGAGTAVGAYVVIGRDCHIGAKVQIYPGVFIGDEVEIGEGTLIYPHVTIRERVRIGRNVIIHGGAVIGSDGFGYAQKGDRYYKIPQVGTVVIEDEVEIGANCTIDRATLGETRIRRGAKLDNLIQVAHNVEIGENTVIAAQTGISGSTKIGRNVVVGGQVGFVGHITIGDYSAFGAQAGVTKSIPPHTMVSGYPARPHHQQLRIEAAVQKLPDLIKRIKKIEEALGIERK